MLKRIISGTTIILITAVCLWFRPLYLMLLLALILTALWEFFRMIEKQGVLLFKVFGLVMGVLIPVSMFFGLPITREVQLLLILAGLFLLFLLELTRKENQQVVFSISATVFGVLYIAWCTSFMILIRNFEHGLQFLAYFLLVTKGQDMGAYFIGRRYGKRPFLKRVSPNKSVEGALGGIATSILVSLLAGALLTNLTFFHRTMLGLILGVISQLGDLFESLIKRDSGVKDSSDLIPGMGGVLDVIDSLIFAAPVFYFYVTMVLPNLRY